MHTRYLLTGDKEHAKGRKSTKKKRKKTINTIDHQEKESKNRCSLRGELKINERWDIV